MNYIDIDLNNGESKRLSLDDPIDRSDELVLAQHLSRRLSICTPESLTPTQGNLLAMIAVLYERIETLERER